MIKNKTELQMRRRNAEEFIRQDGDFVQFKRRTRIITPAGGWVWGPLTTLPSQLIRLVPAKRRYGDSEVNTEAGQVDIWPYQILGFYNLDVKADDTFVLRGQNYIVKNVDDDREERTSAFVTFVGA